MIKSYTSTKNQRNAINTSCINTSSMSIISSQDTNNFSNITCLSNISNRLPNSKIPYIPSMPSKKNAFPSSNLNMAHSPHKVQQTPKILQIPKPLQKLKENPYRIKPVGYEMTSRANRNGHKDQKIREWDEGLLCTEARPGELPLKKGIHVTHTSVNKNVRKKMNNLSIKINDDSIQITNPTLAKSPKTINTFMKNSFTFNISTSIQYYKNHNDAKIEGQKFPQYDPYESSQTERPAIVRENKLQVEKNKGQTVGFFDCHDRNMPIRKLRSKNNKSKAKNNIQLYEYQHKLNYCISQPNNLTNRIQKNQVNKQGSKIQSIASPQLWQQPCSLQPYLPHYPHHFSNNQCFSQHSKRSHNKYFEQGNCNNGYNQYNQQKQCQDNQKLKHKFINKKKFNDQHDCVKTQPCQILQPLGDMDHSFHLWASELRQNEPPRFVKYISSENYRISVQSGNVKPDIQPKITLAYQSELCNLGQQLQCLNNFKQKIPSNQLQQSQQIQSQLLRDYQSPHFINPEQIYTQPQQLQSNDEDNNQKGQNYQFCQLNSGQKSFIIHSHSKSNSQINGNNVYNPYINSNCTENIQSNHNLTTPNIPTELYLNLQTSLTSSRSQHSKTQVLSTDRLIKKSKPVPTTSIPSAPSGPSSTQKPIAYNILLENQLLKLQNQKLKEISHQRKNQISLLINQILQLKYEIADLISDDDADEFTDDGFLFENIQKSLDVGADNHFKMACIESYFCQLKEIQRSKQKQVRAINVRDIINKIKLITKTQDQMVF